MTTVKTSAKGQVVIPLAIRKKIGLRPGCDVFVRHAGDRKVIIEPVPDDPIEAACGMLQADFSWTQALLEERRLERALVVQDISWPLWRNC